MGGTCELGWHVISKHNSFPCYAGIKRAHGARAGHGTRCGRPIADMLHRSTDQMLAPPRDVPQQP